VREKIIGNELLKRLIKKLIEEDIYIFIVVTGKEQRASQNSVQDIVWLHL
jgi:choline kinase